MKESAQKHDTPEEKDVTEFPHPWNVDEIGDMYDDDATQETRKEPFIDNTTKT